MIRFTVPSVPIAQPRQRTRMMKLGKRIVPQNYTPANSPVNAFKAAVQLAFAEAADDNSGPLDGPVELIVLFVMPRPKSDMRKRGLNPRKLHAKKPDIDNLLKSLKDALTGLAWRDDRQVYLVHAGKVVASGGELPHVEVVIGECDSTPDLV